jgi:cell division protein FtsQ
MERSSAGSAGLGRIDRVLAVALPLRTGYRPGAAGAARGRRGPSRRIRRSRAWRSLRALAALLATAARPLRFVWLHRRVRMALLALGLLAALMSGGWLWLRHSSLASVQRIRISGVHGPDAGPIDAALRSAARRQSTLDFHLGALRAAVAPFRVVRDVRATPSFPHGLRIQVIEQLPVAALVAAGTRTAATADGVVLGPALLAGSLPTIAARTAPAPGQTVSDRSLSDMLGVLGAAPAPLAGLIARAYIGDKGLTVVMREGLRAYFGDASRPHAKWLALASVLAHEGAAASSEGAAGSERSSLPTYVDLRVPERPAAGYPPGSGPPAAQAQSSASGASGSVGEAAGSAEASTAALAAALSREEAAGSPSRPRSSEESASSTAAGEGGRESASREGAGEGSGSPSEAGAGAAATRR